MKFVSSAFEILWGSGNSFSLCVNRVVAQSFTEITQNFTENLVRRRFLLPEYHVHPLKLLSLRAFFVRQSVAATSRSIGLFVPVILHVYLVRLFVLFPERKWYLHT